jgi:hypothetical protein
MACRLASAWFWFIAGVGAASQPTLDSYCFKR